MIEAALLASLAGAGFALLVQASPLPTAIPRKPFTCRVCLSGWGSIAASAAMAGAGWTGGAGSGAAPLLLAAVVAAAGTGGARVVLSLAEALQASADRAAASQIPDLPIESGAA